MEKFIVKGEVQLCGSVRISGAKNATLPIMAATLLCSGVSVIHDVPFLRDIQAMQDILTLLGAKISRQDHTMLIDTTNVSKAEIPEHLMREMRASVFLMGPLLGRFRKVRVSYPGGCAIGPRPINLHIKALERIGAKVDESFGFIDAEAVELTGGEVNFDFPSVGATENAMMAAVLAKGTTIIRNAAREPEIADLQAFLNKMGAKVSGAGTDTIRINGVNKLVPAEHTVMCDRIEAGTFLIAGVMTRGDIVIENIVPEYLFSVTDKLQEIGAQITTGNDFIRIKAGELRGVDIKTLPYPGFPTDLQAPMLSLVTIAKGTSIITETIFENRFKHVDELTRMGAKIKVEGRTAIIRGVASLTGAIVAAPDLRAGSALVLAALTAKGTTEIEQVYHIERGYENLEQKLQSLGAQIVRTG
ncbi:MULTISPECIES: UDP-N-acetylglucosamine 1-carboxyvinyltransferase [Sporomusa]|uniref:UDP-N-acetylglucosamine 1-carboxyvinyltransferase n=2 Tax=Sporomusa TaxID=2375 RepID=A0ABM9W070_9FIRM|nr:UDP-N-acetylglucosamine 1-carboxyvinyltransferase [Sporomusa sphaeroides]MCM0760318.1 UDP-N-acetylglucosamine 1-carboxyvinyltransferase [Sporomusa sphaeroides DSM 2875]OLS58078.1 UDP-N-acetylglucosamine 1-carboxyvinyltransferase 1 [Sporomusa sphaeroides DSM 2875]CVK17735.1 UDP-N-acetylglucosamine 1-carboxyvinyltransferase 1 [Sporomusa sphaeroides DSM 2875]SCM80543.1 UDP-N-acetylglucosamine 1-carboxyvinyltransferase 1 [uncultured Sporomusa sp.]HML31412.1 UDP-N-acetylglucosamine 1-carboxyviny